MPAPSPSIASTGPGATAFLDWFTTNKLPKVGRINLTYALTETGTTRTEYTIVRLAEDDYYLISAGAWADYDGDNLRKLVEDKQARIRPDHRAGHHHAMGRLALAGPNSRAILQEIVRDADPGTVLGNKRFPWLSMRNIELGMCPVRAIRVAYTGELGWELHYPIEFGRYLWDQLVKAGEKHGLKLVGARAQNWLRQEKSYRAFGTELGRDATPLEAGLDRFVDLDKDFRGKQAMLDKGIRSKCVTLLIDGPADADPWGREGLFWTAPSVGRLTSGGWSAGLWQADRHGLCPPRSGRAGHQAEGPHVPRVLGCRGDRGQPLRPDQRPDPHRRLIHHPAHDARRPGLAPGLVVCRLHAAMAAPSRSAASRRSSSPRRPGVPRGPEMRPARSRAGHRSGPDNPRPGHCRAGPRAPNRDWSARSGPARPGSLRVRVRLCGVSTSVSCVGGAAIAALDGVPQPPDRQHRKGQQPPQHRRADHRQQGQASPAAQPDHPDKAAWRQRPIGPDLKPIRNGPGILRGRVIMPCIGHRDQ
jgi:glycine cleavage system aminomethyltransferase T